MTDSAQTVHRHDAPNDRYVAEIDGRIVGVTQYHLRGKGIHFFYHTETDPHFAGRGAGSALVRFALDDVRQRGGTVVPLCPFVAAWLQRHPDYGDVVNQRIMDRIAEMGDD